MVTGLWDPDTIWAKAKENAVRSIMNIDVISFNGLTRLARTKEDPSPCEMRCLLVSSFRVYSCMFRESYQEWLRRRHEGVMWRSHYRHKSDTIRFIPRKKRLPAAEGINKRPTDEHRHA